MNAGINQRLGDERIDSELEQRARALLLESVESLSGTVRSRLTQARHAALSASATPIRHRLQRWMPVGAMAAAALTLLVVFAPHYRVVRPNPGLSASIEDIDLLTSDVPLSADQDVDYEFYEWAVDAADDTGAGPSGPDGAAQSAAHGT